MFNMFLRVVALMLLAATTLPLGGCGIYADSMASAVNGGMAKLYPSAYPQQAAR